MNSPTSRYKLSQVAQLATQEIQGAGRVMAGEVRAAGRMAAQQMLAVANALVAIPATGATLARAMYAFHRFHHAITLTRLGFATAVAETAADIERDGLWTAARSMSAARELKR